MIALQTNVAAQAFGFATVSYWTMAVSGLRLATLESAGFAVLQLEAAAALAPAVFDLPAQREALAATLAALDHAYQLGRAHRRAAALRMFGVMMLDQPLPHRIAAPPETERRRHGTG